METGVLGKIYHDAEIVVKQGEKGDCFYVIQDGLVEVIEETDRGEVQLALRGEGEFFGEMSIFEQQVRSATVRALGDARVLTIDKKNFLRRIHEDPSLAFHLIQTLSSRIRELSAEVAQIRVMKEY